MPGIVVFNSLTGNFISILVSFLLMAYSFVKPQVWETLIQETLETEGCGVARESPAQESIN